MATATRMRATAVPTIDREDSVNEHHYTLKVTPLSSFTAELSGLDFSNPPTPSLLKELDQIFAAYGVVVVRKHGPTTDEQLIEFARPFGDLDSVAQHRQQGVGCRVPYDEIFDVSNLNGDDQVIDLTRDPGKSASARGNALWHADGSFNPRRTGTCCWVYFFFI